MHAPLTTMRYMRVIRVRGDFIRTAVDPVDIEWEQGGPHIVLYRSFSAAPVPVGRDRLLLTGSDSGYAQFSSWPTL